jgi:ribose transport system substrate-binding protein
MEMQVMKKNSTRPFKPLAIFIIGIFYFVCSNIVLAEGKTTIAYIGFSTEKPFWVSLGKAVKAEAIHRNLDLIDLTPPDADPKTQVKLLEHAIKKQVNGIIIGANSQASLHQALSKAVQKKIPIIAIDSPIDHPAIFSFIATDNDRGAAMAGQYIVEKTGARGTVLILGGTKDHPNGDARRFGVTKKAETAGMNVLFRRADWNDEKAYQITSEELSKANDITAIFSCWDPGINTASHVIEKMGIEKK